MKKALCLILVSVLLSMACVLAPASCETQTTAEEVIRFDDAVLETIIRKHLNKPEGPVTVKEASELGDWLDANMPGETPDTEKIRSVSALRYFGNLYGLRLDNNLIADVSPLAELKQLKELWVLDNPIEDVQPLGKLTELRRLGFISRFQNVAFVGNMPNLEELRIDGCRELPASLVQLKQLKVFCSVGGELVDISLFAQIPTLESVDVSWNLVTDLTPLSGLPLTELYLQGNPIADYSPIREIYPNLKGRNFEYIELKQPENPDLVITFPDPVMEQKVRQALSIPQGDITAQAAAQVTKLMLFNDWSPQIPKETQITDLAGVEHFINLQELEANFNAVADISILSGMTQLKRINMGGNQITDITPLAGLVNLEGLGLFGNPIRDISPLSGLTSLNFLHLGGVSLPSLVPLQGLTRLEYLYLDGGEITDIRPLAGMVNMVLLDLSNNYIEDLSPLAGMVGLKTLKLANNPVLDYTPIQALYEKLEEKDFEYGQAFDVQV